MTRRRFCWLGHPTDVCHDQVKQRSLEVQNILLSLSLSLRVILISIFFSQITSFKGKGFIKKRKISTVIVDEGGGPPWWISEVGGDCWYKSSI